MSAPTPLADLLERVERLTGPDREVDGRLDGLVGHENEAWPPHYTASIDAALALVERTLRPLHSGMTLTLKCIYSGTHEPYWYAEITWPSSERQGRSTSAPIALLEALLRSLQQ